MKKGILFDLLHYIFHSIYIISIEELRKRIDDKDKEIKLKYEEIIQVNKNLETHLRDLKERGKSFEKSLEEIKAENK